MSGDVYNGPGGWWHKPADDGGEATGPFVTAEMAQAAYDKAKPKKLDKFTLQASPEVVAKLCETLGVPMPDLENLEGFTIEIKAGQPVRVIATFLAQEKPE